MYTLLIWRISPLDVCGLRPEVEPAMNVYIVPGVDYLCNTRWIPCVIRGALFVYQLPVEVDDVSSHCMVILVYHLHWFQTGKHSVFPWLGGGFDLIIGIQLYQFLQWYIICFSF